MPEDGNLPSGQVSRHCGKQHMGWTVWPAYDFSMTDGGTHHGVVAPTRGIPRLILGVRRGVNFACVPTALRGRARVGRGAALAEDRGRDRWHATRASRKASSARQLGQASAAAVIEYSLETRVLGALLAKSGAPSRCGHITMPPVRSSECGLRSVEALIPNSPFRTPHSTAILRPFRPTSLEEV